MCYPDKGKKYTHIQRETHNNCISSAIRLNHAIDIRKSQHEKQRHHQQQNGFHFEFRQHNCSNRKRNILFNIRASNVLGIILRNFTILLAPFLLNTFNIHSSTFHEIHLNNRSTHLLNRSFPTHRICNQLSDSLQVATFLQHKCRLSSIIYLLN